MVTPRLLIPRALGRVGADAYFPFQLRGFPTGFDYPPSATALKLADPEKAKGLEHMLAYAIISACVLGSEVDGERSFFKFERVEWSKLLCYFLLILL